MFTPGKRRRYAQILLGSAILAFGLYNVHALSNVTEGGVLGMTLLLQHWFGVSPAVSGFVMNVLCYAVGGGGFSAFYALFERFPPLWPQLAELPWLAAVLGAVFVGVGVGLSVRAGGAPGGDDALAMVISHVTRLDVQWAYLATDLIVLLLSVSYIPLERLLCSLLTVALSGHLIVLVQRWGRPKPRREQKAAEPES